MTAQQVDDNELVAVAAGVQQLANGLARMMFRDQLGATTDIRFSGWQRNVDVPASTFNFTPPPGADVIGDLPVIQTQPIKN